MGDGALTGLRQSSACTEHGEKTGKGNSQQENELLQLGNLDEATLDTGTEVLLVSTSRAVGELFIFAPQGVGNVSA